MRPIIIIVLAALTLTPVLATLSQRTCEEAGGQCVAGHGDGCQVTLRHNCDNDATCCVSGAHRSRRSVPKRRCKTKGKCKKKKGECVRVEEDCDGRARRSWCKRRGCTCCLPKKQKCTDTPECSSLGGSCFTSKKKRTQCGDGQVIEGVCTSDRCSCCLPPSVCLCGLTNGDRIVGGEEVIPNEYPWVVGLQIENDDIQYECGGSIINNMYILTAAHCLVDQETGVPLGLTDIRVGLADHNQVSQDDDVPGVTRRVEVQEAILHPDYDFPTVVNDIALLKLREPLDLTSNRALRPVCLPQDDSQTYEGFVGTVVGWGLTSEFDNETPDVLMAVELPIFGPDCNNKSTIAFLPITENMLCAGNEDGGMDACEGDSGGPLTAVVDGRHVLVGLSSFGEGCARPNTLGVYTRVSKYLDWIEENTQGASDCD